MNLLNWFFEKLHPEKGTNWLSRNYAEWKLSRRERYNRAYIRNPTTTDKYFQVAGASGIGLIRISERPTSVTGQTAGFSFNVSWNDDTGFYCGVVLGLEEANRLAIHIIEQYSKQTKSEAELVAETYSRLNQ
jgi:hypothetical protein